MQFIRKTVTPQIMIPEAGYLLIQYRGGTGKSCIGDIREIVLDIERVARRDHQPVFDRRERKLAENHGIDFKTELSRRVDGRQVHLSRQREIGQGEYYLVHVRVNTQVPNFPMHNGFLSIVWRLPCREGSVLHLLFLIASKAKNREQDKE